MNHDEAKEILSAYRPNSGDAEDPIFTEALELARTDGELGAWFAREQEFNAKMGAALRGMKAPEDLREVLLAAPKVVEFPARKPVGVWLAAIAACLVVGVGVFLLGRKDRIPTAMLAAEMAPLVDKHQHAFESSPQKMDEVRAWFAAQGAPSTFTMPRGLQEAKGMGCEVVAVRDAKVSLLCFGNGRGGIAHLYVIERDKLSGAPGVKAGPIFQTEGAYAVAMWSDEKYTYLLAERGGVEGLRTIL